MNKSKNSWWAFYLIAPVVLLVCGLAIAAAIIAAYNNVRIARAADQTIRILSGARTLSVSAKINPDFAQKEIYQRIARPTSFGDKIFGGKSTSDGIINPWDQAVKISFVKNRLRIEENVPSEACKRLLIFYQKDQTEIGLQKMTTQKDNDSAGPVAVLSVENSNNGFNRETRNPETFCGDGQYVAIVLEYLVNE